MRAHGKPAALHLPGHYFELDRTEPAQYVSTSTGASPQFVSAEKGHSTIMNASFRFYQVRECEEGGGEEGGCSEGVESGLSRLTW